MNRLFLLALLVALSVESALALDANFVEGKAKTSIALGTADLVSVSVGTIQPPNGYAYAKAYMWGGDETSPPKRIITSITVLGNGQPMFVPLSAYADLGSPRRISLERLPERGFRLIVHGGDAAGSYTAMLDFNGNEISRRKVVSGEFPQATVFVVKLFWGSIGY